MKKTFVLQTTIFIIFFGVALSWGQQTISEEARRYFTRGQTAVEMAKSTADYEDAAREFEQAKKLAPSWPDVYYQLGLTLEKTGNYDEAILNLRTYLQLAPASTEAAPIQETIYKLEYKRDRSNIEGIWKVDRNEMNVKCDPAGFARTRGSIQSSVFPIQDMKLEIVRKAGGYETRVLSSKGRFGAFVPDGAFVALQRDGETLKIFNALMYTCDKNIASDLCPWEVKLLLKQISANTLEGMIEVRGIAYKVVNYQTFALEPYGLACDGKIVLKKEGSVR